MKKLCIMCFVILLISLIGCSNKPQKLPGDDEHIQSEDNLTDGPSEAQIVVISKNKDIFLNLPLANSVVENHIKTSGLTTLSRLKADIVDDGGDVLNPSPMTIEVSDETIEWRSFDEVLYFSRSKTKNGYLRIYSSEDNYVQVPLKFVYRFEDDKAIYVSHPKEDAKENGSILLMGYASTYEAVLNYRIRSTDGAVLTEGTLYATEGAPNTGLYAKELTVDLPSQPLHLEVFAISPKDGSEISKVTIPFTYSNK